MKVTSAGIISLLAAGFAIGSSQFLPANAYGVTANNAITLNSRDVGKTLDPVKWLVPSGTGQLTQDLSAKAIVKVMNLDANFLDLSFNILNTTTASFNATLVSLGLGIDQSVSSVSLLSKGQIFDSAEIVDNQNFSGGFQGIDICTLAANRCSGENINQGLQIGQSDSFTLRVASRNGSFASGVTLATYPVKFQSAQGNYEAAGVPEPITIVGSGLALGFGTLLKKEADKKRSKAKVKG